MYITPQYSCNYFKRHSPSLDGWGVCVVRHTLNSNRSGLVKGRWQTGFQDPTGFPAVLMTQLTLWTHIFSKAWSSPHPIQSIDIHPRCSIHYCPFPPLRRALPLISSSLVPFCFKAAFGKTVGGREKAGVHDQSCQVLHALLLTAALLQVNISF